MVQITVAARSRSVKRRLLGFLVVDRRTHGRPPATSHAAIERAAFRLFGTQGFAATTLDEIAAEVGVSRRTLFHYYRSKNDIPWGQFPQSLDHFRDLLDATPDDTPLYEAIGHGLRAFNDFPEGASPSHRQRMRLILETPELRAHSVNQYTAWRSVIADYTARRTGLPPTDLYPQLVGHACLALALAAYEHWLDYETLHLQESLTHALQGLRKFTGDA